MELATLYLIVIGIVFLLAVVFIYLWSAQRRYASDLAVKCQKLQSELLLLQNSHELQMQAANEKIELLQNTKEKLSQEFQNLSNKIYEQKSREFSLNSKEQLELLLKPFREQIHNFSIQTQQQYETQIKERHLLRSELHHLREMNAQLAQEALNLTKALKGENKTQGNWGEIVLERILEQSGLRKGIEYEVQVSLKDKDSKLYRPDVIVHMPEDRDIVIDSKVSLSAYERFMSAEDEAVKKQALKEHMQSIALHIKELSAKNYEDLEAIHTLDFVLMFMPIEGAFLLALENNSEFFKEAYEQNILVVSPSTLLVTLRTIEHIWRTQRQEEHAQRIAKEAEGMLDKLVLFVEEMQNVGNYIQKTQDAYDKAMNRLTSGRGNVIRRAENIVELGVKSKKRLPFTSDED